MKLKEGPTLHTEQPMQRKKTADAAQRFAIAAESSMAAKASRAEAAWEIVIMTRNQIQEELRLLRLPWWKKLIGKFG